MTATITPETEALLREQVANGQYASTEHALEAAVKTAFGLRASQRLETLLDEALDHPGERIPLSKLREAAV